MVDGCVIENANQVGRPSDALPEVPGCIGNGVLLTKAVAIDDPLLDQHNGMISFWIKPEWDGNDGQSIESCALVILKIMA